MFTRLYIKYNTKFFYLSTSWFVSSEFGICLSQNTKWGKCASSIKMVYVLFSVYIASHFTFFLWGRESRYEMCWVFDRHFVVPGFKDCTVMFDCSHIHIIIYSVEYRTAVLYFLLFKNNWGKDFSVYNFIFVLISILFKTMFHHEIT